MTVERTQCPECSRFEVVTEEGALPVCQACEWTGWPPEEDYEDDPIFEDEDDEPEWDEKHHRFPRGTYVRVDGWGAIAFFVRAVSGTNARVVMVGDDRVHEVDLDDLVELKREDFCGQCGAIGCQHDGLVRDG